MNSTRRSHLIGTARNATLEALRCDGHRATSLATCDICQHQITEGERYHDDGSEIAHTACLDSWFRGNFGREALR